ncbi:MAG: UDP-N-acetylmuramoyl-L-alanine--D-glutamate ligase [Eubacteriales bacterium]
MLEVNGKTALVVGMAKSGIACAKLLKKNGASVYINDSRKLDDFTDSDRALFEKISDRQFLGISPIDALDAVDLLVLSPGVPPKKVPFIIEAKKRDIEIIAEIELGYRACQAPLVAITGTNGKTTCTALTGAIFDNTEKKTFVLGNIGTPFALMAPETGPDDMVVLEAAALQLETTEDFKPIASAVLNITEDHLDRFETMEYYIECKEMIFANQDENDFVILNYDNEITRAMADKHHAKNTWFSRKSVLDFGAFIQDGKIIFKDGNKVTEICRTDDVYIPGNHNIENALACTALAFVCGVPALVIADTLKNFKGVEHRIEFVREYEGIRYINDSKGTNPDATINAIKAMDRPTILILGGYDKKNEFDTLFEAFNENIEGVVVLGQVKDKLLAAAMKADFKKVCTADTFEEAVFKARHNASSGYNVLLSPACASYDMFRNFEIRGERFKEIVNGF